MELIIRVVDVTVHVLDCFRLVGKSVDLTANKYIGKAKIITMVCQ